MAYFFTSEDIYTLKNSQGAFIIDTTYHFTISCNCSQIYNDRRIIIDDMDNDGDLDLIGINGWGGGSSITFYYLHRNFYKLTNNGSDRFIPQLIFTHFVDHAPPFIFGGRDSKSFDMNNDGFVDIISPGLCLKNNANGSYSNIFNFISFNNSIVADLNGDNNIDIVSTMYSTPLITYINNGTENFTQYVSTSNSFSPGSASGDFDNDGDIDIVIVDDNAHDVSILLNGDNPLPAELSSFISSINSNTVNLNWTTTSEENNSGFEIERTMVNGSPGEWSKINFVEGAGNSNTPKNYFYDDRNLTSGKYKYRLKQIDFNGNYKYYELHNEVSIGIPGKFELSQNYPNPFNPSTKINYSIPADGKVMLKIYDVNGKEVQTILNEFKNAGYYVTEFNGSKLASGVYYYRMEVRNGQGSFVQTRKMLLIR